MDKSGGHMYLFRTLTDVQSQNETKKRQKTTFQTLKAHITKTVEVMAKTN